jgi:hypothetical protein
MNYRSRSFVISTILVFIVCFFGMTIGWDTVVADIIVLVVGLSIGLAIGYAIRRVRGDFKL